MTEETIKMVCIMICVISGLLMGEGLFSLVENWTEKRTLKKMKSNFKAKKGVTTELTIDEIQGIETVVLDKLVNLYTSQRRAIKGDDSILADAITNQINCYENIHDKLQVIKDELETKREKQ